MDWTSQGLVGATQMGDERQWTGVDGLGQIGAVSFPVGVGAGQMGGIMGSSQFGVGVRQMGGYQRRVEGAAQRGGASSSSQVGVGQMGEIMSSSQAGVGGGQIGGAGPLASALGDGPADGNHLRGGSMVGASNSSLSVVGVGPIGGISLGVVGGQHQVVDVVLDWTGGRASSAGCGMSSTVGWGFQFIIECGWGGFDWRGCGDRWR